MEKSNYLPLFDGRAKGPLCPYPGKKHYEGYFSDAITVVSGNDECSICLSGGGSFLPTTQKTRVLVKYLPKELMRHDKCQSWENAAIMEPVGKGAALLSMFHPYYGSEDIDVEQYETAFPDSGTDWRHVRNKLSPMDIRMRFALKNMLCPLEDLP